MTSIDFKFFIENDSNPFILFSNSGKIAYLNISAEVLLGTCSSKEIFDIALAHAPQTFGAKKSVLKLTFNSFEFYGINVLYENEEFIGIHLYNKPLKKPNEQIVLDGFTSTDINLLLQANIELFNIDYKGKIALLTDYDIPEFQMHQNNFSLLLRHIFSAFKESKKLEINLKIKLGERVVIKNKNYSIILLELKGNLQKEQSQELLRKLADKNAIMLQTREKAIVLEIPAII